MPKLKNKKTSTRYVFTKEEEKLLKERMNSNEKPIPWTPQLMAKIRQEGLRRAKLLKKQRNAS